MRKILTLALLLSLVISSYLILSINPAFAANQLPYGYLDIATQGNIAGWAYDPDKGAAPIDVHIYIDNNYLDQVVADDYRPDVPRNIPSVEGEYHGFNYQTPTLAPGTHTVKAYAVNYPSGDNPQLTNTKEITISSPLPPYVHAELISVDKGDYKISVDKNTGMVYQLFNKRADPNTNTMHVHYGAGLQIAIHSGQPGSLTSQPCGIQGYWNPTQAGASCPYPDDGRGHRTPKPGSNYHLFCDGILNDNCNRFANQIIQTSYRMMNWDYGPGYGGPYSPADLLYLEQELNLKDSYLQFGLSVINKGIDRGSAFEIPTYYFIDTYRKYYYRSGGIIKEAILPLNTPETKLSITGNFMTVEDPNKPNSSITIAWFYSDQFSDDIYEPFLSIHSAPFEGIDYVKFTNAPRMTLRANKEYLLRYLIIPYKYDEEIETEYGKISVLELIDRKAKLPKRMSFSLSGDQYGLADHFISPGYTYGNFLVDTNNKLLIGLKSGQNYSNNHADGYAYLASQHLPLDKKIRKVEFEYETNFDNYKLFAAINIPGVQFYWKEERFGAKTGKVSLSFPPIDWVAFGLYSKRNFTYQYPDWEWHFLVKNLKFYYDEVAPSPSPSPSPSPTPTALRADINQDGVVDQKDYDLLVDDFGKTGALPTDLNGDNQVDIFDYNILIEEFGQSL